VPLKISFVLMALLALLVAASPAGAITGQLAPAATPGTVECTPGAPSFNLIAKDGRIQTPDGNSVYMWGYADDGDDDGAGTFQMPGPVLCVTENDVVSITLTNNLDEPTSLVFPGQSAVAASGGSPGLLAQEVAPGGTVTYSFVASRPGTYLYESGTEPSKQVEMGMYGAIIVRPLMGANFAYNDESTAFDPEREYLIVIHDIDPDLHNRVDRGLSFDITQKHDHYWTVNGRSFPDSIADSGVSWLPNQPYGSLVWVEIGSDLPALVRYANAGLANHPFHPHGNHLRVIARDGAQLQGSGGEDASMEAFSKTIGSGQTYDLLFRMDDDEGYSLSSPVAFNGTEVVFPGLLNTVFKDDFTFYGGSPYLGEQDDLPTSVTSLNECGEFYYPWHSHALNEFQNFDEGFGGLATLLRVDPPTGCPSGPGGDAPVNVDPPIVSGVPIETQTLTGTNGFWTGTEPIDYTYQWQRDGVDIPGATGPSHDLTADDVDAQVRLCVTATNDFGSATACSAPTAAVAATLRLSFTGGGTLGGVAFADEDIVGFNGTSFALLFDGSDLGLGGNDIDAFAFVNATTVLLSFDSGGTAGGVAFADEDVLQFAGTLGPATSGTFSMYFDGSDELGAIQAALIDVDAVVRLDADSIAVSFGVGALIPDGVGLVAGADLVQFDGTFGPATSGTFSMYFDGSDVGLGVLEDVDAAWAAGNGDIYLSTTDGFAVPSLSGDDDDVFVFTPSGLGNTTAGAYAPTLQFDAGLYGQGGNDVDGAGRRGVATVTPAAVAPALAPAARVVKVGVTARARARTLTLTARTVRCKPCAVQAKVRAQGRNLRTLKMRKVKARYVAVARNLPRGRVTYQAVARDLDSRRSARSVLQVAQIGPAAAVSFPVCADEGSTILPGAGPVPIWAFSNCAGAPTVPGGSPLVVNEGDVVTINFTNNLEPGTGQNVSIVFPGQTLAPDTIGVAPGGSTSYTFTAANPGAYLFESGVNTQIQLPMGLYGTIVVRPTGLDPVADCGETTGVLAYNDCSSAFDSEQIMVLSEIDTDLNTSADPGAFSPLDWSPNYWLINGQAYPDVPSIAAAPGTRVALRYLNAGQEHHTMTIVGMRQRVIGRDSFQPVARPDVMAETIATGSTADAVAVVPAAPVGTTFPLYSRQLDVTNGPAYPGGMLLFIAVP
jgi:FtsP/CotA-like multicopper oxidase with cupredoxin domain